MKTEDLQAQGLTEEQIKFIFAENGKDIAAEKKRADKAEQDRDNWKNRAETAEGTLKGFDGKDFEAIEVIKDYSGIERFIIAKKRDKDAK